MEVVLVHSVEEAVKVTGEGKLPAVDVTWNEGLWLSREIREKGIRQATFKECEEAGLAGQFKRKP